MLKRIIRFLFKLAAIAVLAFIVAGALAYLFREDIKNQIVQELNEQLRTEVQVERIELEMFERFPRLSMAFRDVRIMGYGSGNDTLLSASSLFLDINGWSLFKGDYRIDRIGIQNGKLAIRHYREGIWNYEIFTPSESSSGRVNLDIEKIELMESKMLYADLPQSRFLQFYTNHSIVAASLEKQSKLNLDVLAEEAEWQDDGNRWKLDGLSSWEGEVLVSGDTVQLIGVEVKRGELEMMISGLVIDAVPELEFSTEGLKFDELKSILPASLSADLETYKFRGDIDLRGSLSDNALQAQFSIRKGHLKHLDLPFELERIDLSASLKGDVRSLELMDVEVSRFDAFTSAGAISGQLFIHNLLRPSLKMNMAGELDLSSLSGLISPDYISDLNGIAQLDVEFENSFKSWDWTPSDLTSAKSSGGMKITNASGYVLEYNQEFILAEAVLHYNNRNLVIDHLKGQAGQSDFSFKGQFLNIWEYLLFDEGSMHLDALFESEELHLDEWLSVESHSGDSNYKFQISKRLSYQLKLQVDHLVFDTFEARNIRGLLNQKNQNMWMKNLSFNSSGGQINSSLSIRTIDENQFEISTKSRIVDIDISHLFTAFQNFGQSTLRSEHLDGLGEAEIDFKSIWSSNLTVDMNSILVHSNVTIRGGRLKGFEPLEYLSDYVEIEELRDVSFSQLKNTIDIENQKILIPQMEIKSSALNFGLTGSHMFNNQINYLVRLELTDVMFNKKKLENPDIDDYVFEEDDGMSPNLYLRMTGDVYNPAIKYDLKAAGSGVKEDWQEEKKEIKKAWKSTFSNDSTERQREEEPEYILEWNDSTETEDEYEDL